MTVPVAPGASDAPVSETVHALVQVVPPVGFVSVPAAVKPACAEETHCTSFGNTSLIAIDVAVAEAPAAFEAEMTYSTQAPGVAKLFAMTVSVAQFVGLVRMTETVLLAVTAAAATV